MIRPVFLKLLAAGGIALGASAAAAQSTAVPPAAPPPAEQQQPAPDEQRGTWESEYQPVDAGPQQGETATAKDPSAQTQSQAAAPTASERANIASDGGSVPRKDVFSAAEGVFGKGASGLGDLLERLLKEQGEPTAYITGREAGGAFIAGIRYGSGTLHHQIEGDRPIYWTGPSLGFDFGADANKVFVLVYNLNDSQRMFRRYPAAEGNAYVVGGFTASYMRRGDIVLIPVRLGVGARLGVNAGYMRFSEKNRWLPF
jgi:hypothetical protein